MFNHEARYIENRQGEYDRDEFEKEKGECKSSAIELLKRLTKSEDVD